MLYNPQIVEKQRLFFRTGQTKSYAFRKDNIEKLRFAIRKYEGEIMHALHQDLHKPELEAYSTEIGFVLAEITHILKHLRAWMKPQRVKSPLTHIGAKSYLISEPYGVVLNISPWNYPLNLTLTATLNAMAAGNTVVIKPSELSPHTSAIMTKIIEETFPPEYIAVVEGGVETSTALLREQFDYIIYTGGGNVAKIVLEAAAKHLTPVTLELGGKSPSIVHQDADLKLAAKRIVWGKFINAGQTCISPDYVMVHSRVKESLVVEMKRFIQQFYGADMNTIENLPRMINDRHYDRVVGLMKRGQILYGGVTDPERRYISPTLIDQVDWSDPIMQEEIFGPLLPILEYDQLTDAIEQITVQPKPLALYIFTKNRDVEEQVLSNVSFGGGCINDTVYHMANPYLPFGGVGGSGMGAYHGKSGFDLFSHKKGILKQTTLFDLPFRYPNMKNALKAVKFFMK